MEEKKEPQKERRNSLAVGNLAVDSSDLSTHEIAELIIKLLERPSVNKYLSETKNGRIKSGLSAFN